MEWSDHINSEGNFLNRGIIHLSSAALMTILKGLCCLKIERGVKKRDIATGVLAVSTHFTLGQVHHLPRKNPSVPTQNLSFLGSNVDINN